MENQTSANNITLYLSLEQSIAVSKRELKIKDVAGVYCAEKEVSNRVRGLHVFSFGQQEESQQVITAMKLIEIISAQAGSISVESIGSPETVVYFKNISKNTRLKSRIRVMFLLLIAFLGSAFSIMSYNTDVTMDELLLRLHELYIGEAPEGPSIGMLFYSIGLFIGVVIFFNHGIMHRLTDDPTPLQVQMRLYEQDVNQTVITDSRRNNKTLDIKH